MKYLAISLVMLLPGMSIGQWESSDAGELAAMQNEIIAEDEELIRDDEETLRLLNYYQNNPVPVNAEIDRWNEFPLLNPLLISNLVNYRKYLGDLVSLYELQAVPGFSTDIIKRILPFICLNEKLTKNINLRERFVRGNAQVQFRPVLMKHEPANNLMSDKWAGDRLSLLARYKYKYKQLLQYGFAIEKDAGEQLMTGKFPFLADFRSVHLICRDLGLVKTFAVGDYVINLGQGLIQWHSQALKKSAAVLNVKRQGDILKPYQSSGEFYFFRGTAAMFRKNKIEGTFFISARSVTANISNSIFQGNVVTSFNTSGLHRTESEIHDKNSLQIRSIGGNLKKITSSGHIGLNMISHDFSVPLLKRNEPYNLHSIKGSNWINFSSDFAFTIRNVHLFGEMAMDKRGNPAIVTGLLASLHPAFDVSFVYRDLSASYQALFGNAFTENTLPSNERGIYLGSSLRLARWLSLNAYADIFSLKWMKFRVDGPSDGSQYLLQLTWKPRKQIEVYTRWRRKIKPLNNSFTRNVDYPDLHTHSSWRAHINYDLSRLFTLRTRVEVCNFYKPRQEYAEPGYVYYVDVLRKSSNNGWSANCRMMYFETETYDSRIYAYENDLYLNGSTTAFSGSGVRLYLNLRQNFRIKKLSSSTLTLSLKLAATFYTDRSSQIHPVDNQTKPNHTDIRFQLFFQPTY